MSFHNKTFDFFGKMKHNKDFYLFDNISPEIKSETESKFDKFKTAPDFFEYFTNKDVKLIFQSLEQLDLIYSNLLNEQYSNNLQSKTDIFISNLSEIILLYNLISKNKTMLEKATINAKKNLEYFYTSNTINKNDQNKLNEYILNLLGLDNKRIFHPLLFLNDNVSRSNTLKSKRPNLCFLSEKFNNINNTNNTNNYYTAIKIVDNSMNNSLNQEKTHDLTDQTYNNSKIIEENVFIDFKTPKFPKRLVDSNNNIINEQNVIDDSYDKLKARINKQESLNSNKNYSKKESIHSLITLASKSKFIFQEEKVKGSSKFKDFATIDNNKKEVKHSPYHHKKSSKYHFFEYKLSKINSKDDDAENEIEGKIKKRKKQTFSSTNLKSSKDKKMLKDLLGYINEIFKKDIINSEEKIKLKSLIISKYEKLENIYIIYFENNKDLLIKELKKLI